MTEDTPHAGDAEQLSLPRHLAALVGALQGPADLGRNHDMYLSFEERDQNEGIASS